MLLLALVLGALAAAFLLADLSFLQPDPQARLEQEALQLMRMFQNKIDTEAGRQCDGLFAISPQQVLARWGIHPVAAVNERALALLLEAYQQRPDFVLGNDLRSHQPVRHFSCELQKLRQDVLANPAIPAALLLLALLALLINRKWRKDGEDAAKARELVREVYSHLQKLAIVASNPHSAASVTAWIAVPQLRDTLLPPSDRRNASERMRTIWARVEDVINVDTRVVSSERNLHGEQVLTWQWASPIHRLEKK